MARARRAYRPEDAPNPLSVYGRTKLEGEAPVRARGARGLVLRTSWVYSAAGSNFVKTMLRLMATRPEMRVVSDQIAAPTWARGLAEALWRAVERPQLSGVHHWRDAGVASWYDFAVAIAEEAHCAGPAAAAGDSGAHRDPRLSDARAPARHSACSTAPRRGVSWT